MNTGNSTHVANGSFKKDLNTPPHTHSLRDDGGGDKDDENITKSDSNLPQLPSRLYLVHSLGTRGLKGRGWGWGGGGRSRAGR